MRIHSVTSPLREHSRQLSSELLKVHRAVKVCYPVDRFDTSSLTSEQSSTTVSEPDIIQASTDRHNSTRLTIERSCIIYRMMGASCSSQRQHNHRRRHTHRDRRGDTNDLRRHRSHIVGGVGRFRTFPFCGASQVRCRLDSILRGVAVLQLSVLCTQFVAFHGPNIHLNNMAFVSIDFSSNHISFLYRMGHLKARCLQ